MFTKEENGTIRFQGEKVGRITFITIKGKPVKILTFAQYFDGIMAEDDLVEFMRLVADHKQAAA